MKQQIFSIIKSAHKIIASRPLPNHLGLYFHALESHHQEHFFEAINYFTQQGYQALSSSEYLNAPKDQKCLFVSFDDNYRSWHTALPVLERCAIQATFYVNTLPLRDHASDDTISDYFDRINHHGERVTMSTNELKEIASQGHEIGCHSHSHFVLSALDPDRWDAEILGCKTQLEDIIKQTVTSFSYPYGMRRHFSEKLETYCFENGFQTIAAAIPGLLHTQSEKPIIHRTRWHLHNSLAENLIDLSIDGRIFEKMTGKSAIG